MRARKDGIEQRAVVCAESASDDPVKKSRSMFVEEPAIFFIRSDVSMVLVALNASYKTDDTFFFRERDWPSKRAEPKMESISSELISTRPL